MLLFNTGNVQAYNHNALDFNTSNVTIQQTYLVTIFLYIRISIHLMLLFNINHSFIWIYSNYFNTSNVTIQLYFLYRRIILFVYFNTSNVTIQLPPFFHSKSSFLNFNTSNVTIQLNIWRL